MSIGFIGNPTIVPKYIGEMTYASLPTTGNAQYTRAVATGLR